jgi:hypothetical protein
MLNSYRKIESRISEGRNFSANDSTPVDSVVVEVVVKSMASLVTSFGFQESELF